MSGSEVPLPLSQSTTHTLTVWSLLMRVDLSGVPEATHQMLLPMSEMAELVMEELETPPDGLVHTSLTDFLSKLNLVKEWKSTKTWNTIPFPIGRLDLHLNVPESHQKPTCYDCGMPLSLYLLWVELEVRIDGLLSQSVGICPGCNLLREWAEEAESEPEYREIVQTQPCNTGDAMKQASWGWKDRADAFKKKYVSERTRTFLHEWTKRDLAWWKTEKMKSVSE